VSLDPFVVRFDPLVLRDIADHAAAAYPNEGCGALLGAASGEIRLTLPIANRESRAPQVRFEIAPRDYLKLEADADALGLALLGFWHSHPEGLALPSTTDRAHAWEDLFTVIVAVHEGEPDEITAWRVRGPDLPFEELPIEDGTSLVSSLSTLLASR
jgi:proteasome lid subunit RPN8/RPN11